LRMIVELDGETLDTVPLYVVVVVVVSWVISALAATAMASAVNVLTMTLRIGLPSSGAF
jgi:hypothetical protein